VYVALGFTRSKTTEELELVVHMLVVDQEVDVDTHIVHYFNVLLLKNFNEACLVYKLLKRMQVELETLVLAHNWAPKIQDLVHRVLLESCQADSLLEDEGMVLEEFLTVVTASE